MSLAVRRAVIAPVLEAVLGADAGALAVTVDQPWLLISVIGEDGFAVGFEDGPDDETPVQTAIRLVEILATDLPTTRRFWGRPVPECTVGDHVHALEPRAAAEDVVELCCPVTEETITVIRVPAVD